MEVELFDLFGRLDGNKDGDDFNWFGIWKEFKAPSTTTNASSLVLDIHTNIAAISTSSQVEQAKYELPSPKEMISESNVPPLIPSDQTETINKEEMDAREVFARRQSKELVVEQKQESQPLFANMRQLLKPLPLSELPRSMSQDDANAIATSTPSPPKSELSEQPSASKLQRFLKTQPPNQIQRQPSEASVDVNMVQTSNEIPYESSEVSPSLKLSTLQNESRPISSLNSPSSFEYDIFGQASISQDVDPEVDLLDPPSPQSQAQFLAQTHQAEGIPSQDSFLHNGVSDEAQERESSMDEQSQLGNGLERIRFDLLNCLQSIKSSCLEFTIQDEAKAKDVLAVLMDIKSKIAMRNLPRVLTQELRTFDRSSLSIVDDAEKQYNSVSIQHVEQAIKIRAFRKHILPQIFPQLPDDPLSVLGDLFPDIFIDTIKQMFDACEQDLQSCFKVLSGLSDYSNLVSTLSPKQSYLRKQFEKKKSGFFDEDDDLNELLFQVKGYTKPERIDKGLSKRHSLDIKNSFYSLPKSIPDKDSTTITTASSSDEILHAFTRFESGQDMPEILSAWSKFNRQSVHDHLQVYPQLKQLLQPHLSFRQTRIFEILDKKQQSHPLYNQKVGNTRRVCVVGGGPVGLRSAIELALLGSQVIVLEKRSTFNRENILHLFPWVVHDLTELGAKAFYRQFCMSSSHLHIGTRQLQCILLKVALMLGVAVYGDTVFDTFVRTEHGIAIKTTPALPETLQYFTAIIGAGGSHDTIGNLVGIKRRAFSPSPAVGAVAIFPNLHTKEERAISQFSWASQYNQQLFSRLKQELGVDAENIVYYREEVHYVVMTPKKSSLVDSKVLRTRDLSSVDTDKLYEYMRSVLTFFNIPHPVVGLDVKLFDFSQTLRANRAAVVIPHPKNKLFVALIGDALLEPFWPQGLGINRGFLSALDTAYAITRLDKTDDVTLLADHDKNYKRCAALNLQRNISKYNIIPASRYRL